VNELEALLLGSVRPLACDAMTDAIEAAEALDVEVQQLAWPVAFVAYRGGGASSCLSRPNPAPRQIREPIQD
jgi:hypothetical protein